MAPVEQLLSPLASGSPERADLLLDFLAAVKAGRHPGRCVRCYFDLLDTPERNAQPAMHELRAWLEANIEVVARDEKDVELERIPLQLRGEDLQEYCYEVIDGVLKDRAYPSNQIGLEFRFRFAA